MEIEDNGFENVNMRKLHITKKQAQEFYQALKDLPFYPELCEYMCSGPVIAMVLKKGNAVLDFRELIGATDPAQAKVGSLRKKYGISI